MSSLILQKTCKLYLHVIKIAQWSIELLQYCFIKYMFLWNIYLSIIETTNFSRNSVDLSVLWPLNSPRRRTHSTHLKLQHTWSALRFQSPSDVQETSCLCSTAAESSAPTVLRPRFTYIPQTIGGCDSEGLWAMRLSSYCTRKPFNVLLQKKDIKMMIRSKWTDTWVLTREAVLK